MPKFYCDYCDTYLTHNTPSVRKTHCNGRKHKENVKLYYQKWMEDQAQSLIDATTAAFMKGKLGKYPGNAIPPPQSLGGPPMRPMGPGGMGPAGMRPMPPMGPMGPMGPMPPGMPPGMMAGPPMMGPGKQSTLSPTLSTRCVYLRSSTSHDGWPTSPRDDRSSRHETSNVQTSDVVSSEIDLNQFCVLILIEILFGKNVLRILSISKILFCF